VLRGDGVDLALRPFQIVTLRVRPAEPEFFSARAASLPWAQH
jgi:hypothetical protein